MFTLAYTTTKATPRWLVAHAKAIESQSQKPIRNVRGRSIIHGDDCVEVKHIHKHSYLFQTIILYCVGAQKSMGV